MFIAFVSWWYGDGWGRQLSQVSRRIEAMLDYFSMGMLVRTLFSPFRQISAGAIDGSFQQQLQAVLDKLISRMIGAMVRLAVLFIGAIAVALTTLGGLIQVLLWPFLPLAPVVGLLCASIGWLPWR